MKIYRLKRSQFIARSRGEVFAFFSRPENLARLTPASLGFQILTPLPIRMHTGALIDYTIRVLGITVRWTTLITDYAAPQRFADVQIRGPYSYWHHAHSFEEKDGGTWVHDEVHYALAFARLGRLAHALFVGKQLQGIFDYRAKILFDIFKAE